MPGENGCFEDTGAADPDGPVGTPHPVEEGAEWGFLKRSLR